MKKCKIIRDGKVISYNQIGDRVRKPDKNIKATAGTIDTSYSSLVSDSTAAQQAKTTLHNQVQQNLESDYANKLGLYTPVNWEGINKDQLGQGMSVQVDPTPLFNPPKPPFNQQKLDLSNGAYKNDYNKYGVKLLDNNSRADYADWLQFGDLSTNNENLSTNNSEKKGEDLSVNEGKDLTVEQGEKGEKEPKGEEGNKGSGKLDAHWAGQIREIGKTVIGMSSMFKKQNMPDLADKVGITGTHSIFNNRFASGGDIAQGVSTGISLLGNAFAASELDEGDIKKQLSESSKNITAEQQKPISDSYDDLMNQQSQYKNLGHLNYLSAKDFDDDTLASVAVNSIGAGLEGSATGAQIGGVWGGIIGGVLGTGSSLFGAAQKYKKAIRAADESNKKILALNEQIDETNEFNLKGFDNAFNNIALNNTNNALRSYGAEGGYLVKPIKPSYDTKMEETRFEPILTNDKKNGKYGTSYKDGGVFELNNDDVDKLQKNGYIIEKV